MPRDRSQSNTNGNILRDAGKPLINRKPRKREQTTNAADAGRLLRQLEAHQIELEMQNETLCRLQEDTEESRARYADLYDFSPVGYLTFTGRGLISQLNLTAAQLLDHERELLINKPFGAFVKPESQDALYLHRQNVLRTASMQSCELVMKKKNGTFHAQLQSIAVEVKRHRFIRSILTDITERKQLEDNLRIAREDLELRVRERTAELEAATVSLNSEIIQRRQAETSLRDTNRLLKLFSARSSKDEYLSGVVGLLHEWTGCEAIGIRVLDKQGNLPYGSYRGFSKQFWESENLLSVTRDRCACIRVVTGRPETQDMPYMTPGGSFHCGDTLELLSVLSEEEKTRFRGKCIATGYASVTIIPVSYRDEIIGAVHLADRTKAKVPFKTVEMIETVQPLIGEALHRFGLEEDLTRSEENYRSIFENSVEGIFQRTLEGRLLSANPAMAKMFGYDSPGELLSSVTNIGEQLYVSPEDRSALIKTLKETGAVRGFEVQQRRKDGSIFWVVANVRAVKDKTGNILRLEGTYEDITERKRAEEERVKFEAQLRQAQKMEAIGTLAGGIAHDFNNILGAVLGFAEMMEEDALPGSPEQLRAEQIQKAGLRGRDLVKQILTFSRQTSHEKEPVALRDIIEEVLKLLRPALPSTIAITTRILTHESVTLADSVQMHQILMNLCTNAAHAMSKKGGLLEITLEDARFPPGAPVPDPCMKSTDYLKLSVRDTGQGIEEETLKQIFDPFFTTKAPGEGTGLGLSVVHGIVRDHTGCVVVESKPGRGSTFHVYLPKLEASVVAEIKGAAATPRGNERILFVDDEQVMVDLNKERLRSLGYKAVTCVSSKKALDIFKKRPDRFDLIIADYTMPDLTGINLAEELFKVRPDVPVILCTGAKDPNLPEMAKKAAIRAVLTKPFTKKELAEAVRKVLDEKKSV